MLVRGIKWIWKLLGFHVHEYGRWEQKRNTVTYGERAATAIWQERKCASCGKVQQSELEFTK